MAASSSSKKRSRATLATVHLDADLRSTLVHLPLALYGPLLERGVPPQSVVVELLRADAEGNEVFLSPADDHGARIDKIYVGWSGMSAAPLAASTGALAGASSSAPSATSVVCMSATLAATFSPPLQADTSVRITLLRSPPLPTASRIDVVPLSADDWEVLSLNADEVENSMLGQVRAARTGMVIAVHVGRQGRTVCRFRVESCTPPTQDYAGEAAEGAARAVRLSTDTEVVIAPRGRAMPVGDGRTAESHDLGGTGTSHAARHGTMAAAHTPAAAQEYLKRSPFRVLPAHYPPSRPAARVVVRPENARILSLAFAGHMRDQGRCALTKMPCPAAPYVHSAVKGRPSRGKDAHTHNGRAGEHGEAASDAEQSAGLRHEAHDKLAPPAQATTSAYFASTSDAHPWPPRHVWLSDEIRSRLGLVDYDLVRFSSPSPSGASLSRPTSPELPPKQVSPTHTASELAGMTGALDKCLAVIQNAFRSRAWAAMQSDMHHGSRPKRPQTTAGLLLTGASGSGKSSMTGMLAERLVPHLVASITIDCTQYADERFSALRGQFDQWLAAAVWHSPTLLILDNLDRIAPAEQEHVDSPRSAQVAEALMQRARDVTVQYPVLVLATAQSANSLHKACTVHRVFGETVELKAPSKEARRDILAALVARRPLLAPTGLEYVVLAGKTEGYLPIDLRDLVERAVHQSAIRGVRRDDDEEAALDGARTAEDTTTRDPDRPTRFTDGVYEQQARLSSAPHTLTMNDFAEAQTGFTPLSLRDIQLTRSTTRWGDIGGLHETRRVLRETLEWPTRYARIFAQCPLRLRSGLLLYGYPGCGKTLLAGAVAAECGLNFISVKGPEILQKYIGASEKSVRDLFDRAQAAKPCVLFFDEFDSIAPKRGHDSTGVTDRVVNQLLTQMDGAEGLAGVYVLAATSRPDLIDSALLRPGRLDKSLLCDLPDEADRLDILHALCHSNHIHLAEDVDLAAWARRTRGFSGADLQALVYNAHLEAIHEGMGAEAKQRGARGTGEAEGQARFVRFGGRKEEVGAAQSGAERQAVQRRVDVMLRNAAGERRAARPHPGWPGKTEQEAQGDKRAPSKRSQTVVREEHMQTCLGTTRQSVPLDEQARLRRIYRQFVGERSGAFPDGEASREVGARQSLM